MAPRVALGREAHLTPLPANGRADGGEGGANGAGGVAAAQAPAQPDRRAGAQAAGPSPAELLAVVPPSLEGVSERATAAWRAALAAVRGWPGILLALTGVVLTWTRLLALEQGLWGAEINAVSVYIRPGPGGILGHFTPNDQLLFELFAWAGAGLTGGHDPAAYRFWGVLPALAAVALTATWLWRRLDRWVAAIFAVLATASPLCLELGTEAQGYGLGFLAVAVMVIGADGFARRPSRGALTLLVVGALVGIWTLPVIVLPFLAMVAVVMAQRLLRRRALIAVGIVGAAALLFYAPVLSEMLSSPHAWPGAGLPWYAPLVDPVRDLLAPSVALLAPNAAVALDWLIAAALVGVGLRLLWRSGERTLAMLLAAPAFLTYLCLTLARARVVDAFTKPAQISVLDLTDRTTSFLLLPLLVCVAVGLVGLGRRLARVRAPRPFGGRSSSEALGAGAAGARPLILAVVACAALFTALALTKTIRLARNDATRPLASYAEVGAAVKGTKIKRILTNSTHPAALEYYVSDRKILAFSPAVLEALFCHSETAFIYIEVPGPAVDTACLEQRRAPTIRFPQRAAAPIALHILRGAPGGQQVVGER